MKREELYERAEWQRRLVEVKEQFEERARKAGIPLMRGDLRNHEGVVSVENTPFEKFDLVRQEVSFALLDAWCTKSVNDETETLAYVHMYLRLGKSNLWLSTRYDCYEFSRYSD